MSDTKPKTTVEVELWSKMSDHAFQGKPISDPVAFTSKQNNR
jgi:hypothetical protein